MDKCEVCGQDVTGVFNATSGSAKINKPCHCRIEINKPHDPVNHPKHYNNSPAKCECGRTIECIDITRHMGFNLGNAIKYIWRYADKNGLEDLKKAAWYLNDFINREKK